MSKLSFLRLALALALASCAGKTDGSTGTASTADQNVDPATYPVPDVAPFTAAEVAAARARCDLPEGPVETVTTRIEVERHVIGAWYRCDIKYLFGPESDGIQLLPDGTFAALNADADGSFVKGLGYDNTGTWEPYNSAGSSVGEHWYVDFSCGACSGDSNTVPVFEASPKRMKAHMWSAGGWLVPLLHGS